MKYTCFLSANCKQPREENHDFKYENLSRFSFKKGKNGQEFPENTKLYLHLVTHFHCYLNISVYFPMDL